MKVLIVDNGKHGKFFIEVDGTQQAEMTFTWAGDKRFIIDHTEVNDTLRGKNAGKLLVIQAVTYAREHKVKILPLCPFAKSVFNKTPEIRDVL